MKTKLLKLLAGIACCSIVSVSQDAAASCIGEPAYEEEVTLEAAYTAVDNGESLSGCVLAYRSGETVRYAYSPYQYLCSKLNEKVRVRISHDCCDGGRGTCTLTFGPHEKGVSGYSVHEVALTKELVQELVQNLGSDNGLLRGHAHYRLKQLIKTNRELVSPFSDKIRATLQSSIDEARSMSAHMLLLLNDYEKEHFPELLLQVMDSRYVLQDEEFNEYLTQLAAMPVDLKEQLERLIFLYGYIRSDDTADAVFIKVLDGQEEHLPELRSVLLRLAQKVKGSQFENDLYNRICNSIHWPDTSLQKAYLDVKHPYQSFLCPYTPGEKIDLTQYFISWTKLSEWISAIPIEHAYVNEQRPEGFYYMVSLRAESPGVLPVFTEKLKRLLTEKGILERLERTASEKTEGGYQYRFRLTLLRPLN